MKKTLKISLSVLLCLSLVFTSIIGISANEQSNLTIDMDGWYETWDNDPDIDTGIHFGPGSDESERGLAWYASADSSEGYVLLSTDADLADAQRFDAEATTTVEGDKSYSVTLTDLEPATTYYYSCVTDLSQTATYSFSTLDGNDFSAIYVNDIHVSDSEDVLNIPRQSFVYSQTLDAAIAKNPNASIILSGGDQGSDGVRQEYVGLAAGPAMKALPFAGVIGNHDRKNVAYKDFFNYPNMGTVGKFQSYIGPNYWFVKGDALFLMMDSNNSAMDTHDRFIEDAIEQNPDVKWRVIIFHHELFGGRIESREQENRLLRTCWTPLTDRYNIDLVLSGHSHYYSMSNVISGGKTEENLEGKSSVKNADGTIFFASGSVNRPRYDENVPLGEHVAFAYLTQDIIYNIIDFSEDAITINSYTIEGDEHFNSFTIEKDIEQSERELKPLPLYYPFIKIIGAIAMFGNNIGTYYEYRRDGFMGKRPFSMGEAIFGK